MKELIYTMIEGLNNQILESMKNLTDARRALYEAQENQWPLEGKQNVVKFYEERLEDLKSQLEDLWSQLNKINGSEAHV